MAAVDQALAVPRPRKLSFKVLERELEGKLQVDEVLVIAVAPSELLTTRLQQLNAAMGQLRERITDRAGLNPDGIYANFVRMKAEVRVLTAELTRRGGRG